MTQIQTLHLETMANQSINAYNRPIHDLRKKTDDNIYKSEALKQQDKRTEQVIRIKIIKVKQNVF